MLLLAGYGQGAAQETPHQLLGSVVMLIVTAEACKIGDRDDMLASLAQAGQKLQSSTRFPDAMLRRLAAEVSLEMEGVDCTFARTQFDVIAAETLSKAGKLP